MKSTLTASTHPCTEWCGIHETEGDICYTDDLILDFEVTGPWSLKQFGVGLAAETDGKVVVQITVNNIGAEEVSPNDARRMAFALLAVAATAERGGAR